MPIDHPVHGPSPTLLVHLDACPPAPELARWFADLRGVAPASHTASDAVVWVGDVADPAGRPLAAAVLRFEQSGRATVRAIAVTEGPQSPHLERRLVRGVVEAASAQHCSAIAVDPGAWVADGPFDRADLVRIAERVWAIER